MTAKDYPITTPYGYVAGYPLNNGFHRGIDYGCPIGTPVDVAGTVIGNSGNTGYSTGPHLHVGAFIGGESVDPTPYQFKAGEVTETGYNDTSGNFVRIQVGSASVVYLHMSKINVAKGQKVGSMTDKNQINAFTWAFYGRNARQTELDTYSKLPLQETINRILTSAEYLAYHENRDKVRGATVLAPGTYQVK